MCKCSGVLLKIRLEQEPVPHMPDGAVVTGSVRHRKIQAIRAIKAMDLTASNATIEELAKNIAKRFPNLWTEEKIVQLMLDARENRLPETEEVPTSLTSTPVQSGQLDQKTPQASRSSPSKTFHQETAQKAPFTKIAQLPVLGGASAANPVYSSGSFQANQTPPPPHPADSHDRLYRNHISLGLELAGLERKYLMLRYDANRMFAPPRALQKQTSAVYSVAHYEKQHALKQLKERIADLEGRLKGRLSPKDRATYTAQYNAAAIECRSLLTELDVINLQAEEDGVIRRQVSTYCLSNYYNNESLPVLFPMNADVTVRNYQTVKLPPVASTVRPRYILMKKLGSGGFSTVYKAMDLSTAQIVALKISRKETSLEGDEHIAETKRWLFLNREAAIYHHLKHPNIVQLNSDPIFVNSTTGRIVLNPAYEPYNEIALSMELCEGGDLHDFLALLCRSDKQARTEHELLTILLQIAEALKYLHTLDSPITHNDISLRNILLAEGGVWKLSDFTLVKPLADKKEVQMVTSLAGTKPFTAPEKLLQGVFGPASDMYSYGVVAFACFVGNINLFLAPNNFAEIPGRGSLMDRARTDLCSGTCYVCNPSDRVVDLITNLLCLDMNARMTAEQVCQTLSEMLSGYRKTKIKI